LTALLGISPFLAGVRGRCPNCGTGALFSGFLGLQPRCSACRYDFARVDSGDGPAVFVIIIAGFLMVFGALVSDLAFRPPIWVDLAFWLPAGVIVCLALLRPAKGLMIAAQIRNRGEGSS
jgi:uncharacterized protein (DUF983 family)